MTHSVDTNDQPAAEALRLLYAPVLDELARVEQMLKREMRSDFPFVNDLVQYGVMLGGKRMRPALLLLAAKAAGEANDDHITLATVVEMIHTATLVHDDVLDEATMRRHLATVNARWDNEASVLLGDFLFSHAFFLASTLDSTHACRLIGRATNIVCEGEIRQKGSRGDFLLSEDDYIGIVSAKTAELCAVSCQLGAIYAGASPESVKRLAQYGRDLGIAFQIADDLLDVQGDEGSVGKSLGTDLEKQKPTLPLIRVLQQLEGDERAALVAALERGGDELRPMLTNYYDRFQAIEYSREQAQAYADRARQQLDHLAGNEATETLRALPEFVVHRSH